MLRLLSSPFLFFSCLVLTAMGENAPSQTEIIFSIVSGEKTEPPKGFTQHEKNIAEHSIHTSLREMGLSPLSLTWTPGGELKVVLPALGEAVRQEAVKELTENKLIRYGHLTLNIVHPQSRVLVLNMVGNPSATQVPGYRLATMTDTDEDGQLTEEHLLIKKTPVLDSSFIEHAQELYGPHEGKISVKLNKEGAGKMFAATRKMAHGADRLAIILDGKILSAPVVQDTLGAQFEISGMKDAAEAKAIAAALLSPLNHALKVKSINPPLAK